MKLEDFAIAAGLNFSNLNFLDIFFLSTTIFTFIKTKVLSHLKQLNLPIKYKKLINLGDPGLLLLPAEISVTLITMVLCRVFAQM